LLKKIIEASLEGELDEHLQDTRKPDQNRRNGYAQKIFRIIPSIKTFTKNPSYLSNWDQ
jgi:hypothetical protein